ncbi:MAG: hypothetical protein PHG28_17200 [Rhodoferax sp.]|nr:hypothetical protein [Rhodoferax sp.]
MAANRAAGEPLVGHQVTHPASQHCINTFNKRRAEFSVLMPRPKQQPNSPKFSRKTLWFRVRSCQRQSQCKSHLLLAVQPLNAVAKCGNAFGKGFDGV